MKYRFWANLIKKNKIVSLTWNLFPEPIQVCKIQWWCSLFLFWGKNALFDPKNENRQFNLAIVSITNSNITISCANFKENIKIATLSWNLLLELIRICILTNENMQNSVMMFVFSLLELKYFFLTDLFQNIQIVRFRLKFDTYIKLNMQTSMDLFTISVLHEK